MAPEDVHSAYVTIGKYRASKRVPTARKCETCGSAFRARSNARYCSPAHRKAAQRAREREYEYA